MFKMENLYAALGDVTLFNVFVLVSLVFYIITFIIILISLCKLFSKAFKTDVFALVPFFNFWVWFEICGISGFWSLIPIVNIVLLFVSLFKAPVRFGKKWIYGLGIMFIPYLFLPYLAFNNDLKYIKPEIKNKKKKKNKKSNTIKNEDVEVLKLDGEVIEILNEEEAKKVN